MFIRNVNEFTSIKNGGSCKKLIKAGGKTTLLHYIFQRQGIPPDEFFAKPYGVQLFMLASKKVELEEEEKERQALAAASQQGGGVGG